MRTLLHQSGGFAAALRSTSESTLLISSVTFLAYLLCVVLLAFVIGQQLALCIFIATYLWRWGGYNWKIALGYAACGWLILYGFYDKVMHVPWHQSWVLG